MMVPLLKGSSRLAFWRGALVFLFSVVVLGTPAQNLPINLQGRIAVDGVAFTGTGKFKFALVSGTGAAVLWTHDGTSGGFGFEPTGSIDLQVTRGLYSVLLGDALVFGMTQKINPAIFSNTDIRLRIWFNDGVHGFQKLSPDQRLSAVGYAFTSQKSQEAATLTGNVNISQVPAILVTNNAVNINLTGSFTGDGSGLTGIRGSTPFQVVSAIAIDALPNTGYLITNVLETTVRMPTNSTLRIGDIIRIAAPAGTWKATLQTNQQIKGASLVSGLGATWTPRAASARWSSVASSADGVRLIAGTITSGHLQYSRDGGVTWASSTSAVDPVKTWAALGSSADGLRLLAAASGNVLYLSKDGADTWNPVGPSARNWKSVAVAGDGTNMVAVVSSGTLWVSNDGGDTWKEKATLGVRTWSSTAAAYDGSRLYASGDGFFYSLDKGTNWTPAATPSATLLACSPNGLKLVGAAAGQIITSVDGGTNWTTRTSAGTRSWTSLAISADGSRIIGTVTGGRIYVSLNGGTTWTATGPTAAWTSLAAANDATKLIAVPDTGNIYISESLPTQTTSLGGIGYLIGNEYSSVELQYIGNGAFMVLTSAGNLYAY
jgi:hypothetical protein